MWMEVGNREPMGLQQIGDLLRGSAGISFKGQKREEVYRWVEETLVQQEYARQGRKARGRIREYLCKMTGKSKAQISRLIAQYRKHGQVRLPVARRHRFARRYTEEDIALLAAVDRAHERLSGPATRRILEREHQVYEKTEFARLAGLSVAHLYNLRQSAGYRKRAAQYGKTQAVRIHIGERRRPQPEGQPGYLRVDTVHQGDQGKDKGLYHINAVDEVTQWEVVGCVPQISERYLVPVLEAILHQFPFPLRGFHSDNGSEFVNHTVAQLLNKLLVEEFTRSRPARSQDNALVEGKNGAIVRKHIGYGYIAAGHAQSFQKFYTAYLNPYLNFHRPCGFATVTVAPNGRRRRRYRWQDYRTPWEKLCSLPEAARLLKPGLTLEALQLQALRCSDTEAAQRMRQAKHRLLSQARVEWPQLPERFADMSQSRGKE
jgi:hypothetical protein